MNRRAILIRGYHYHENHNGASSFFKTNKPNRGGKYNLDYRRHFKDTFKKYILDTSNIETDIFISTENSPIAEEMLNLYNPKKYIFLDFNKTKQAHTLEQGLQLIKKYSFENNIKYDYIFCTRFDLKYYDNPINLFDLKVKNKISVFSYPTQFKDYDNWKGQFINGDFVHLIPPEVIDKFIIDLEKRKSNTSSGKQLQSVSNLSKYLNLYNIIPFNEITQNIITIDREFCDSIKTSSEEFKKYNWR